MLTHIPIYHQQGSLDRLARNQTLRKTIHHRCQSPDRYLTVDWNGNCFICACESWLPISVGLIDQFDNLQEIWNNDISRLVQADISDKKFSWCAVDHCGIVDRDILHPKHTISINIDDSCNLHCPSCRSEPRMLTHGAEFEKRKRQVLHLVSLLEKFDQSCHIIMSGNGDVLASQIMRPFLHQYQPRSDHTFRLFTNGLLLRKQLQRSLILPQITEYQISVDAGSAAVYERTRLGGKWTVLMDNLDFLSKTTEKIPATVMLMFVLQRSNWRDMQNFVDLCRDRRWHANITALVDWGSWSDFKNHDVIGNTLHPEHRDALSALMNISHIDYDFLHLDSSLARVLKQTG
jgi:MoaA/NifB/PqqE/SkfB family radical SAM enzyme